MRNQPKKIRFGLAQEYPRNRFSLISAINTCSRAPRAPFLAPLPTPPPFQARAWPGCGRGVGAARGIVDAEASQPGGTSWSVMRGSVPVTVSQGLPPRSVDGRTRRDVQQRRGGRPRYARAGRATRQRTQADAVSRKGNGESAAGGNGRAARRCGLAAVAVGSSSSVSFSCGKSSCARGRFHSQSPTTRGW